MHPTRRQKAVLEAIQEHIAEHGRPPTLQEIAVRCGLSSVATVHRHLSLLQERGLLRRRRSRRRGIELRPAAQTTMAAQVPHLGTLESGRPIEPLPGEPFASLPRELIRRAAATFVVRVRGDALRAHQILEGDLIIAERRERQADGDLVVIVNADRAGGLGSIESDRGALRVRPLDGAGAVAPLSAGSLRIEGVVTGLLRTYV
ncbi:MAG TPA: helix-turn-helix domain-containing protein [Patescibacteria group bacterium]|nr:helix-turn-helix domain-containing protein [Patescibacteria group bacterium]